MLVRSNIEKAVWLVGGQSAMARILGCTPQAVQQWVDRNRVPAERVLPIEAATSGRVTRHELRPDLYPVEQSA